MLTQLLYLFRFSRYVNSGVAFLDLDHLKQAYAPSDLQSWILPSLANDTNLTSKGQWPPEQWLWNAMFEHNPEYLTLFGNSTHCNCASHPHGMEKQCKVVHYCNAGAGQSVFSSQERFSVSVKQYLQEHEPKLVKWIKKQQPISSMCTGRK